VDNNNAIDFSDYEAGLERITSVLLSFHSDPLLSTPELAAVRAAFDVLWTGEPIKRDGTSIADSEERMLWLAMDGVFGKTKYADCVAGGWNIRYGQGDIMFKPFGDVGMVVEYMAAISALRNRATDEREVSSE